MKLMKLSQSRNKSCLVSLLSAGQIQLISSYNESNRTVKLGSSFNFSWNYSGDLRRVEWGTKKKDRIAIDVRLFVLDINGPLTPDVPQYNNRRNGSWNRQSRGQVMFTLKPIKEVDNQVFIFRFVSNDPVAPDKFDMVRLIVKGKNFYDVMNCCFVMEDSMKFWNGQVMPFNTERNNFSAHCKQKKCCHEN